MKLKKNLDTKGRVLRLIFAIALLGYAIWKHSWLAAAASAFVFFESFMSWCIVYQILGINSCPINKK